MLTFNLEKPVELVWFGEFISPDREWTHLTRNLTDYELMIVTEGVLYIADDEKETEVHMGEYLIMPPRKISTAHVLPSAAFIGCTSTVLTAIFPCPNRGGFRVRRSLC